MTGALAATALFFSRVSRAFVYLTAGAERLASLRVGIRRTWDTFNTLPEDAAGGLFPVEREGHDPEIGPMLTPRGLSGR